MKNLPALLHGHRTLVFLLAAMLQSACAGSVGSPVSGLPADEFNRAYAAGYDIAAAERCGAAVDAGLVRYNLVEDVKRRGLDPALADKSGLAFDKTRAEFARKLKARPDYCVTEYTVTGATLAQYQKGEFSAPR